MTKVKTVLVVEDERSLNDAYKIVLDKAGYKTFTAFDGEEALEKIKQEEVDLILLDLKMPKVDGIGFLKELHKITLEKTPRIIIFSNYDMQAEIDDAYKLGADRYILKAWASPKELLRIIEEG